MAASAKTTAKRKYQTRARKDDDKALVQSKLLSVATEQFGKRSFDAVSMRDVAQQAGYTPGTIYQYFSSKTALYICVKEAVFNKVLSQLEGVAQRETNARLRLIMVLNAYAAYWVENADHFKSLFSMSGSIEDRRMPDGTLFGESETAIRAFNLFNSLVRDFFTSHGAQLTPLLNATLTSTLLSACHGSVALPMGAMTMKLPDSRLMCNTLMDAVVTAWEEKIALARQNEHWPRIRKIDIMPEMVVASDIEPVHTGI